MLVRKIMNLRIAICDDDDIMCHLVEDIIQRYALIKSYNITVDIFNDGLSLIKYIEAGFGEYNLIYLDIEMRLLNGVEAGVYIRSKLKDHKIQIVYISAHSQYDRKLFEVQPLFFIPKPINEDQLLYSIDLALEKLEINPKFFFYKKRKEYFQIQLIDIMYFMNSGRKVEIYTIDGMDIFVGSIRDIARELRFNGFIQVSQSSIINYNYVKKYSYEEILLMDNKIVRIPKNKRNNVREQFLKESDKYL